MKRKSSGGKQKVCFTIHVACQLVCQGGVGGGRGVVLYTVDISDVLPAQTVLYVVDVSDKSCQCRLSVLYVVDISAKSCRCRLSVLYVVDISDQQSRKEGLQGRAAGCDDQPGDLATRRPADGGGGRPAGGPLCQPDRCQDRGAR